MLGEIYLWSVKHFKNQYAKSKRGLGRAGDLGQVEFTVQCLEVPWEGFARQTLEIVPKNASAAGGQDHE